MHDEYKYKNYEFSGMLANHIADFVSEKRSIGYIYNSEAKLLRNFSEFSLNYKVAENVLSEEVVRAWISKKVTEADKTCYSRFSIISQFAKYMSRQGYSAYIPDKTDVGKIHKTFIPYIFTHEEIKLFLSALDTMETPPNSGAPRRKYIFPVLFRLLYCCGLRVSEAAKLKGENVDLDNGILTIQNSKFGNTRYVPMSKQMTLKCIEYNATRLVNKTGIDWFFAAPDGGYYDTRGIYSIFREYLWKAGISHHGKGKGPRLHDLRHTFAVHCLQKWVSDNEDLTTALPRLSAYMGHHDFTATEQYLRLTAEIYPEFSELMNRNYGFIIPRLERCQNEKN